MSKIYSWGPNFDHQNLAFSPEPSKLGVFSFIIRIFNAGMAQCENFGGDELEIFNKSTVSKKIGNGT